MKFQSNHRSKKLAVTGFLLSLLVFIAPCEARAQHSQWHSFEEALARADSTGKFVVVDVAAPWCGWCLKMKQEVYPALSGPINKQYVFTRLNRDDNQSRLRYQGEMLSPLRWAQMMGTNGVPATVILSSEGGYLLHLSGFRKAIELEAVLRHIIEERRDQTMSHSMD